MQVEPTNKPRPNRHTYWLHDQLLAGEYPGEPDDAVARARLRAYLDAGVDFFVDLTRPGELRPYDALLYAEAGGNGKRAEYRRLPIVDMGVPRKPEMVSILDTIDQAVADGRTVYIHCWGGVGRTGTVIGCYLVRHGRTGQEALDEIAGLWPTMEKTTWHPRSPETREQVRFVRDWREEPGGG